MNVDLQHRERPRINTWLQTCCLTILALHEAAHLASQHVTNSAFLTKKTRLQQSVLFFESLYCLLSHYTAAVLLEDVEGRETIEFKC